MPELPCFMPRAEVGDVVYYISPNNRYAVKRAIVVEIQRSGSEYRQVMSNGDVVVRDAHSVEDYSTFDSRDEAVQFILPTLSSVSMITKPASPHFSMNWRWVNVC